MNINTNPVLKTWIKRSYLLALHLLLAVLIVKTNFIPKMKERLGLAAPTPNVHLPNMLMFHKWMDESVPAGATIFIGDSILQGLATAAVTPDAVNYGIGGLTAAQLIDVLPDYRSLKRARAIVLSVGVNDIVIGETAQLAQRYERILSLLPSNIPLVWNAVLPTRISLVPGPAVRQVNARIRTLCANRPLCEFVDVGTQLADNDGNGLRHFYRDDDIHLNPQGYQLLITALREALHRVTAPAHAT